MGKKGSLKETTLHGLDFNRRHGRESHTKQAERAIRNCQPYLGQWPRWKAIPSERFGFEPREDEMESVAQEEAWLNFHYPFENLVFNAGGTRLLAYMGALSAMEDAGILCHLRRFAGCSSGALVATLLAIGCTPQEIIDVMVGHKSSYTKWLLQDQNLKLLCLMPKAYHRYGLRPMKRLNKLLGRLLERKLTNKNITFKELHDQYNREVVMVAANVTRMSLECFSADTTPDMAVREALRLALAMPGLYEPARLQDGEEEMIYVDGSILNDYPLNVFDDQSDEVLASSSNTLGIFLFCENQGDITTWRERYGTEPPEPRKPTYRSGSGKYRRKYSAFRGKRHPYQPIGLRSQLRDSTTEPALGTKRNTIDRPNTSSASDGGAQNLGGVMDATIRTMMAHQRTSYVAETNDVHRTVPINCGYLDGREIIFRAEDKRYMLDQGYQQTKFFLMAYSRRNRGAGPMLTQRQLSMIAESETDVPVTDSVGESILRHPQVPQPNEPDMPDVPEKVDKDTVDAIQVSQEIIEEKNRHVEEAQQKAKARLSASEEIVPLVEETYMVTQFAALDTEQDQSTDSKEDVSVSTMEIDLDGESSCTSVESVKIVPMEEPAKLVPSAVPRPLVFPRMPPPPPPLVLSPSRPKYASSSTENTSSSSENTSVAAEQESEEPARTNFQNLRKHFLELSMSGGGFSFGRGVPMAVNVSKAQSSSPVTGNKPMALPKSPPVSPLATPSLKYPTVDSPSTKTTGDVPIPPAPPLVPLTHPARPTPLPANKSIPTPPPPPPVAEKEEMTLLRTTPQPTSIPSPPPVAPKPLISLVKPLDTTDGNKPEKKVKFQISEENDEHIWPEFSTPGEEVNKPGTRNLQGPSLEDWEKWMEDEQVEEGKSGSRMRMEEVHEMHAQVIPVNMTKQSKIHTVNTLSNATQSEENTSNVTVGNTQSSLDSRPMKPVAPPIPVVVNALPVNAPSAQEHVTNIPVARTPYQLPTLSEGHFIRNKQRAPLPPVRYQRQPQLQGRQLIDITSMMDQFGAVDGKEPPPSSYSSPSTPDVEFRSHWDNLPSRTSPYTSQSDATNSLPQATVHSNHNTSVIRVGQARYSAVGAMSGLSPWSAEPTYWSSLPTPAGYGRSDLKLVSNPWSSGRPVAPQSAHALSRWNTDMDDTGQSVSLINV